MSTMGPGSGSAAADAAGGPKAASDARARAVTIGTRMQVRVFRYAARAAMGPARLLRRPNRTSRGAGRTPSGWVIRTYAASPLPGCLLPAGGLILAPTGRPRLSWAHSPHAAGGYERS